MTTAPAPATEHEGISPAVRRNLRKTVLQLRAKLEDDFRRQLAAIGITATGVGDAPGGRSLSDRDARARTIAGEVLGREVAGGAKMADALDFFVEECAFTFLNWAFGLRCLEERGLLILDGQTETAVRVDPARGSSSLYWRVRNSLDSSASPREVWSETFRQACTAMSEQVSVLFDEDSEYAALFPLLPTVQAVVDALNAAEVPSETYATDELLGWVYQYFNTERKDEVFAAAAKGKKIEGEDIIAATQIYTERYMVDFLLQNGLGRMWVEMHPETRLRERWPYYLAPPKDNPKVEREAKPLRDVTVLDPAVGSGHFLLRAADLLFDMYEEEGAESREHIPRLVLERNLYGIDIDLRSVQIAALALYMKAATYAEGPFVPERLNLVAADAQLAGSEPAEEYLKRFQGDTELEELVQAIWQGLHHVRDLGSLLHPERAVDEVLERRRAREPLLMQEDEQWERWKRDLLDGLRDEFEKQTENGDIGRRLLGAHVARGISLVDLLSRKYDVVCTNPPYMGSKNMGKVPKDFVFKHYAAGKRDLYAAFILRCRELALAGGFVAMVTQQSWMFLRSYADLRAVPESKLRKKTIQIGGILRETSIEAVAHLGPRAFEEVSGEVVNCALFVLRNAEPPHNHRMTVLRLVGLKSADEKATYILQAAAGGASGVVFTPRQSSFLRLAEFPMPYWLSEDLIALLEEHGSATATDHLEVWTGLSTHDVERFVRYFWETVTPSVRWYWYPAGGGYRKWRGNEWLVVDWEDSGERVRRFIAENYPPEKFTLLIKNPERYGQAAAYYGAVAGGSLGVRVCEGAVFSETAPALWHSKFDPVTLAGLLNCRLFSYFVRSTSAATLTIRDPYMKRLPLFHKPISERVLGNARQMALAAIALKSAILSNECIEREFAQVNLKRSPAVRDVLLLSLEGALEDCVIRGYGITERDVGLMVDETGLPAGWHPLIEGYDEVPEASSDVELPDELINQNASSEHRQMTEDELKRLKDRLRLLYIAGPGAKLDDGAVSNHSNEDEAEAVLLGAHMPIPSETFLEALSQKLEIHPVSVYWLLEEMREREGLVCPPEVQRQTEDYLSVNLLRMLGYRWPMQDEYEKERDAPFLDPKWVDADGIIPLTPGAGQTALVDRIRGVLREDFGEDAEAGIGRTLGWKPGDEWGKQKSTTLERWFEKEFFKRHIQQFKQRPIAWHVTSPEGAFQAFVLYHRLSRETLTKLRTQYAGAAISHLRTLQERAKAQNNEREVTALQLRVEDVEEFRQLVEKIERGDELKYRIRCRWKDEEADGRPGPYAPDIDDGVKVNVRPFQEAGLLAATVIKKW